VSFTCRTALGIAAVCIVGGGCALRWPWQSPQFAQALPQRSLAPADRPTDAAPVPSPSTMQARPQQVSYQARREPAMPAGVASIRDAEGNSIDNARIVAVVGNQSIQAGEIQAIVNQMISVMLEGKSESEISAADRESYAAMRERLFRTQLQSEIQIKLIYLDFVRTIPEKNKIPEILKNVNVKFEQELNEWREKVAKTPKDEITRRMQENATLTRLSLLMAHAGAESLGELEGILRKLGSSLERELRSYAEFKIAHEMRRRNAKTNTEITHEQMLDHYREHREEYAITAKARWEQLSIHFNRCSSREEALQRIAELGNAVYLGGAALSNVARKESHDSFADKGGYHDWTSQGSLASGQLDQAIFSLPLNRLSEIIEDERGVHIIRVLERTEAGYEPFESVQESLREKIKNERLVKELTQYVERLQKTTYIWTVFDGESGIPAGN
jgi:parvulin-like peptidyl-prolyl isomerase